MSQKPTTTLTAPDTLNGVPVSHCLGLVEAVRNDPAAGQTTWRSSTTWKGGFTCESQVRSHVVVLDEPATLGGADTAPNMVEAILASYGSCLTVGYTLNAAVRGIEVRSLTVDVEGHLDLARFFGLPTDKPAGFTDVHARVHIDADATPEQLADLHAHVLATSPVGSILKQPIAVTTELVGAAV